MKKIIILLTSFIFSLNLLTGESLQEYLDKIAENQNSIKSEIAIGKCIVNIYNNDNELANTLSNEITLYLKHPDKIKIILNSTQDNTGVTIVQTGDTITQKMSNSNQLIKQKVTNENDIFKKYLGYGIEKILQVFIFESGDIKDNIIKFTLVPKNMTLGIDKYIVHIDKISGMDVYDSYYYNKEQAVEINKDYIIKDNIRVLKKLRLMTYKEGMKIETIFDYKSIDLNTKILDKEFEIK